MHTSRSGLISVVATSAALVFVLAIVVGLI
jgi:hypothetical protein